VRKRKQKNSVLPSRYDSLRTAIVRIAGRAGHSLDMTFARVEAQRLRAETELRGFLARCWSNRMDKDFSELRPTDIVDRFLVYAKEVYAAVARESIPFCRTERDFKTLLSSAKKWVVSQIVGQEPQNPEVEEEGIIRLDETVAAFEERVTGHRYQVFPFQGWGGDWGRLLDDTMVDAIRLNRECVDSGAPDCPFFLVLKSKSNLSDIEEFFEVELSSDDPTFCANWWDNFSLPRDDYKTPLGCNIDKLRRECGWSFNELAERTGLDKKLILGHVKEGKGAHPNTLRIYADAFTKKLNRTVKVAELEGRPD
jgi:hypothetical protein